MSSRTEKERIKQIHEKCQRLLNEMLKDEDNKYCVDCDAKGPRWASWNIGIFLCIRCAGIHRKVGVHISRVKSVNLDTWTPQQVVSLQQMGNSRARAVYEANLPDNFRRPQSDGSLETFIRAKYEQKKYIARGWVAPPLPKVNWDKELEEEAEKLKKKKREVVQSNLSYIRPIAALPVIPQPLPKPQSSSPKPSRTSTQTTTDLLGLNTPTKENNNNNNSNNNNSDSDLFSNFLNATPETPNISTDSANASAAASASRSEEEENFFNQSMSCTSNKQKQLTKDSILALYGNPSRNFGVAPIGAGPTSHVFNNAPLINGSANSFPKQSAISQTALQSDLMQVGMSFANNVTSVSSSANAAVFAANPFYSMAASEIQSGFAAPKGFTNFAPINNTTGLDFQQAQFNQQMEGLNLNDKANQFSFPQTNLFDTNNDTSKGQHQTTSVFGQSVTATSTNFWE